jgi:tRNA pseudouridine65 synthase
LLIPLVEGAVDAPEPASEGPLVDLVRVDDALVVVNKPSGLAVHRGWAAERDTAVVRARRSSGHYVHAIHRLDRATSGLLVFARTEEDAAHLRKNWEAGAVDKRYLALVRGRAPDFEVIDHPIPRVEKGPRVPAGSTMRKIADSPNARCSLVEIRLHTGRLHQARRHLKHLSHPIVGDVRYGDGRVNRAFRQDWELHRLALHAWFLRLEHPRGGELVLESRPSGPLAAALENLGLDLSQVKPDPRLDVSFSPTKETID